MRRKSWATPTRYAGQPFITKISGAIEQLFNTSAPDLRSDSRTGQDEPGSH